MNKKELDLKEIQQESFKILKKIKEIFDQNGWKYYLIAGTLIGAVRHKGFIPWDDDIDIWVPRPDYEKFVEYCIKNKEKIYPFELMHYKTNDKYIYPIARFSDSRYEIDYENTENYGLGLFVDLYPLDGVKNNYKFQKKKMHIINTLIALCGLKTMPKEKNILKKIFKIPIYKCAKKCNIHKLIARCDQLAQKYKFDDCDRVECVCWADNFYTYEKDWIFDKNEKFLEFNGEMFRVPCKYDKVLTKLYGDYMKLPPKEEQIAHHFYKAYKK